MSRGKVAHIGAESATRQSGLNNGERANSFNPAAQPPMQQPEKNTTYIPNHVRSKEPNCPECGSQKLWKDGLRYIRSREDPAQRWLCRRCGYRFSENGSQDPSGPLKNSSSWSINTASAIPSNRQVCELLTEGSKNLATVETQPTKEKAAGATTPELATIKGLIIQYMAWLEKEGYYEDSSYVKLIKRLVKLGGNLRDPEHIKQVIAQAKWKDSVKMLAVHAYDIMARNILKIQWMPPTKYKQEDTLPFVPDEKELDSLIAACKSRRMAAFLQTLKETYADPGEVLRLEWKDFSGNIITINSPVKGHKAGQMQISNRLVAMLIGLPKTSTRIFPIDYASLYMCFRKVKKRAAHNLQNPRLLQIAFRSFRHWGGSMIAHYTNGNVLTVQKLLRHKSVLNSMKYIHMLNLKDDEFEVTTATDIEEAKKVLGAGFEYVTQKDGIMLFRKPKRFKV